MKILCAFSSIEFTVSDFPGEFYSREVHHPAFDIPQKKLLCYTKKWAAGELTPINSYLLFLSILKSSDLVDFYVPVYRGEKDFARKMDAIIAQNMEYLVRTVIKLNTVSTPSVVFPRFRITPETRFLINVHHWIESWAERYQDFTDGCANDIDDRKLVQREAALQRMIKNPHKHVREYASSLAEWAAIAGEFPEFLVTAPGFKTKITLSEYWKNVITRCTKDEYLFSIPKKDLDELLEHCETNLPNGTIQSHLLFQVLRRGVEKQKNFLDLGDSDVGKYGKYGLMEVTDTVESANMQALIDSAPEEEPKPEQYPNKILYLKAKFRWNMSKLNAKRNPE